MEDSRQKNGTEESQDSAETHESERMKYFRRRKEKELARRSRNRRIGRAVLTAAIVAAAMTTAAMQSATNITSTLTGPFGSIASPLTINVMSTALTDCTFPSTALLTTSKISFCEIAVRTISVFAGNTLTGQNGILLNLNDASLGGTFLTAACH